MSYDEPKILSSQLNQFCLIGVDGGQEKAEMSSRASIHCGRPRFPARALRAFPICGTLPIKFASSSATVSRDRKRRAREESARKTRPMPVVQTRKTTKESLKTLRSSAWLASWLKFPDIDLFQAIHGLPSRAVQCTMPGVMAVGKPYEQAG